MSLLDLLLLIRDAGEDPRVAGMVVRVRPLAFGWAKAQDIRDALIRFQQSGKPLHAYLELELGGGTLEYYVASAAEHIHVPPGAAAPVTGLLAQFVFLGGVWEKLDVEMQVVKIREYKTAGDMLANKEMSPLPPRDGELAARQHVRPVRRRHRHAAQFGARRGARGDRRRAGHTRRAARGRLGRRRRYLDELRVGLLGEEGKFLDAEEYAGRPGRCRRARPSPSHRRRLRRRPGHHRREPSPRRGRGRHMGSDTLVKAFDDAAEDDASTPSSFASTAPAARRWRRI